MMHEDPAVVEAADTIMRQQGVDPTQLASEHIFLDSGHRGYINDGDPKSYIHKGGRQLEAPNPEMGNPLEGGAGKKHLRNMDQDEYNEFDGIYRRWEDRNIYGTGDLARGR